MSPTLGNPLPIQPDIPLFPLVRPWTFNRNINILPNNNVLDTKFNASGMLGKGKDPSQYGIADVSDYLGNNSGDTVQISNDEYMSRQTGIPRDVYKKFRQHTNNARASLPYDAQPLAPQPSVINIKTTKDPDGESYSATRDRRGSFLPYVLVNNGSHIAGIDAPDVDRTGTLLYNGYIKPPRVELESSGDGLGVIRIRQQENPASIRAKWDKYIKNRGKDTAAFYDVLKHEVAHQNTAKNINDVLTLVPGVKPALEWYGNFQRSHPTLTAGTPKIPVDVDRDLNIENVYHSFSPHWAFRQNTYFNEPGEAWGAANRVKNDGAGLFYKKYGRLPGFDDLGEPITGAQKVNDIKEAVRLFHQENPGNNAMEHMRIKNLETSPNDVSDWMLNTPYEDWHIDQADPGVTMWDLVHNNSGIMNKVASANLMGLYKAASEVKEAGKIMKVKVSKLMRGKYGWRGMAQFIYMPDCLQYRDIIENGTGEQLAKLANKFILNQKPDMVWTSCLLEIVEK